MEPSIFPVSTPKSSALATADRRNNTRAAGALARKINNGDLIDGNPRTLAGIIEFLGKPCVGEHALAGIGGGLLGVALHHAVEIALNVALGFEVGLDLLHDGDRAGLDGVLGLAAGHAARD